MTLYSQGSGPTKAHTEAHRAQELISCLVGVAHAEVLGDARGSVREVHVWATGQFPTQQTVRNVESALRAHMDIALDRSRIRVMLGEPPSPAPPKSPEASEETATEPPPRRRKWDDDTAERTMTQPPETGHDPSASSPPRESSQEAAPSMAPPTGTRRPWARSGAGRQSAPFAEPQVEDRIVYDSYEVVHHRSRVSAVRVLLEWKGTRFMGQAHGTDDPMSQAEALAYATLSALEAIARSHGGDTALSLDLLGIQFTDAFEHRLVVVAVEMRMGTETLPVSGSVVVQHGLGLAAILAVLQATDRRVRALLESSSESPGPH